MCFEVSLFTILSEFVPRKCVIEEVSPVCVEKWNAFEIKSKTQNFLETEC